LKTRGQDGAMAAGPAVNIWCHDEPAQDFQDCQANQVLGSFLSRLEAVLKRADKDYGGQPLFAVEVKLRTQLQDSLPQVRFMAEDIKAWAAEISSYAPKMN
jgi:hypothetical protein